MSHFMYAFSHIIALNVTTKSNFNKLFMLLFKEIVYCDQRNYFII